jgi:hypothetical protein
MKGRIENQDTTIEWRLMSLFMWTLAGFLAKNFPKICDGGKEIRLSGLTILVEMMK